MSPNPERESMRNMVARAMIASLDHREAEEDGDIRESGMKVSLGCKAMLFIDWVWRKPRTMCVVVINSSQVNHNVACTRMLKS
jgi:hypothetical protein